MQNPELDVHRIRTTNDDELFFDLVAPFLNGDKDRISSYRLKHIIPGNDETAYAVYEATHDILAVQFYLDDTVITFGDDEPVQFMSMDEIRFIKELGNVTIDGMSFSIDSTTFNIIDGSIGCQHMIVINLKRKY